LEPAASWFVICPPESLLPEIHVACSGVCDLELRGVTFDFDYSNDFGQQLCGAIIFPAEPQSAESDQQFDLKPFPPVSSAPARCILMPLLNKRQMN
jgi:hypothetical protein